MSKRSATNQFSLRIAKWLNGRQDDYSSTEIARGAGITAQAAVGGMGSLHKSGYVIFRAAMVPRDYSGRRKFFAVKYWRLHPDWSFESILADFQRKSQEQNNQRYERQRALAAKRKLAKSGPNALLSSEHPYAYYRLPRDQRRALEGRPVFW